MGRRKNWRALGRKGASPPGVPRARRHCSGASGRCWNALPHGRKALEQCSGAQRHCSGDLPQCSMESGHCRAASGQCSEDLQHCSEGLSGWIEKLLQCSEALRQGAGPLPHCSEELAHCSGELSHCRGALRPGTECRRSFLGCLYPLRGGGSRQQDYPAKKNPSLPPLTTGPRDNDEEGFLVGESESSRRRTSHFPFANRRFAKLPPRKSPNSCRQTSY